MSVPSVCIAASYARARLHSLLQHLDVFLWRAATVIILYCPPFIPKTFSVSLSILAVNHVPIPFIFKFFFFVSPLYHIYILYGLFLPFYYIYLILTCLIICHLLTSSVSPIFKSSVQGTKIFSILLNDIGSFSSDTVDSLTNNFYYYFWYDICPQVRLFLYCVVCSLFSGMNSLFSWWFDEQLLLLADDISRWNNRIQANVII